MKAGGPCSTNSSVKVARTSSELRRRATTIADLGFVPKPKPVAPPLPPAALAKAAVVPQGDQVRVTRGTDVTGYTLSTVR